MPPIHLPQHCAVLGAYKYLMTEIIWFWNICRSKFWVGRIGQNGKFVSEFVAIKSTIINQAIAFRNGQRKFQAVNSIVFCNFGFLGNNARNEAIYYGVLF